MLSISEREHNEWGYANQMLREAMSVSLPLAHQPTPADVITRDPAILARAET